MKKYLVYACVILVCFLSHSSFAHATAVISEVMYDHEGTDTDHEWVELYNPESEDFSLIGVKFADSSNHTLNEPPTNGGRGSLTIPAGGYVIIAQDAEAFIGEFPSYTGTVIDTVMSLNNTGSTVRLISQSGSTITDMTYDSSLGAAGDGKTLQWNNGLYVASSPTPGGTLVGSVNGTNTTGTTTTITTGSTTSGSGTSSGALGGSGSVPKNPDPQTRTFELVGPESFLSGTSFTLKPVLLGYSKEPLSYGAIKINMGDGTTAERRANEQYSYTYEYSGVYTIVAEWYKTVWDPRPEMTVVKIIRVEDPGVLLEPLVNGGLRIKNNSPKIADISQFSIVSGPHIFTFPAGSRIVGANSVTLSPLTLGFSAYPGMQIFLKNPFGAVAATYPEEKKVDGKKVTTKKSSSNIASYFTPDTYVPAPLANKAQDDSKLLSANAANGTSMIDMKYLWLAVFLLLIVGLIGFVFYLKYAAKDEEGEEYELVDE